MGVGHARTRVARAQRARRGPDLSLPSDRRAAALARVCPLTRASDAALRRESAMTCKEEFNALLARVLGNEECFDELRVPARCSSARLDRTPTHPSRSSC